MGMSLDTKAIYGWHVGHEDDVGQIENYHELNDEQFKAVQIEAVYWCDYVSYFISLKTETKYEHDPIVVEDLKPVLWDREALESDLRLIKSLGIKDIELPRDMPKWFCIGQYF